MGKPPIKLPLPVGKEIEEGTDAIAEAAAVAGGLDLSSRADLNKINSLLRRDKMDGHLHRILVVGLYVAGLCIAGMFVSVVWNMSVPPARRFLDAAELSALQSFLFSGTMGSAITAAARKVGGQAGEPKSDS